MTGFAGRSAGLSDHRVRSNDTPSGGSTAKADGTGATAPPSIEELVDPSKLLPHRSGQKQRIRLVDRRDPAVNRRPVESRDLEQAIAVRRPFNRREQRVLTAPVIAGVNRQSLARVEA